MTRVGDIDRTEKFDLDNEWRSVELVERLCREAGRKIVYIMHNKDRDEVRVNGMEGTFNSDRHDLRDVTRAYVDLRTEGVAAFLLVYEEKGFARIEKDHAELMFDFLRCAQNESYSKPTKKFLVKLDKLVDVVMRKKDVDD